ncbi:MAG: DUF167 domain-containing protein [Patescibacteria group bacterium]
MELFHIKVHPGSKREELKELGEGKYELWIKDPARRGSANRRVKEIVATLADVSIGDVRLLKGGKSPTKTFTVNDDRI